MEHKLAGLIGMARRAGRLTTGFDAVREQLAAGKAAFVLLAADLSAKTEKELLFGLKQVNMGRAPFGKEEMARALGFSRPVGVASTDDEGFAAAMKALCGRDEEEESAI